MRPAACVVLVASLLWIILPTMWLLSRMGYNA